MNIKRYHNLLLSIKDSQTEYAKAYRNGLRHHVFGVDELTFQRHKPLTDPQNAAEEARGYRDGLAGRLPQDT